MKLYGFTETKYYLSLDRTNWNWGKININLLELGVVYRGTAVPVYWLPFNKSGNSNSRESIALLKRFIDQFGRDCIKGILADCEFIGYDWQGWLFNQKVPFTNRIRKNSHTVNAQGEQVCVDELCCAFKPGEKGIVRDTRPLGKQRFYLSALHLSNGELCYTWPATILSRRRSSPMDFVGKLKHCLVV